MSQGRKNEAQSNLLGFDTTHPFRLSHSFVFHPEAQINRSRTQTQAAPQIGIIYKASNKYSPSFGPLLITKLLSLRVLFKLGLVQLCPLPGSRACPILVVCIPPFFPFILPHGVWNQGR